MKVSTKSVLVSPSDVMVQNEAGEQEEAQVHKDFKGTKSQVDKALEEEASKGKNGKMKFDSLLNDPQYRVLVERTYPIKFNKKSVIGQIAEFYPPITFGEITKQVAEEYGGRKYRVLIKDDDEILSARTFVVDEDPKMDEGEELGIGESDLGTFLSEPERIDPLDQANDETEKLINYKRRKKLLKELSEDEDPEKKNNTQVEMEKIRHDYELKFKELEKKNEVQSLQNLITQMQQKIDQVVNQSKQEDKITPLIMKSIEQQSQSLGGVIQAMASQQNQNIQMMMQQQNQSVQLITNLLTKEAEGGKDKMSEVRDMIGLIRDIQEVVPSEANPPENFWGILGSAIQKSLPDLLSILKSRGESGISSSDIGIVANKITEDVKAHAEKVIREVNTGSGKVETKMLTLPPTPVPSPMPPQIPSPITTLPVKTEPSGLAPSISVEQERKERVNAVLRVLDNEIILKPREPQWVDMAWADLPQDILDKIIYSKTEEEIYEAVKPEGDLVLFNSIYEKITKDTTARQYILQGVNTLKNYAREEMNPQNGQQQ